VLNVTVLDLVKLSLDVANGCRYLEENHFIHRSGSELDVFILILRVCTSKMLSASEVRFTQQKNYVLVAIA